MATVYSSAQHTEMLLRGDFYVTGGTLRPDAPCYVERQADKDLCQGLLNGEFCYVLTSRQMGKSSLMVRTVQKLRGDGVAVAVLDLTAIGQNLTIEQWYDGLISRLGQQLRLEDELEDFGKAHPEWGPLQRWTSSLEHVVLKKIASEVVIFVDEIDIVRSLPFSTDEFFAAIRECFNRRSHEPSFNRLAFGLLGVATPTDLIRDTRMTPFNIGRRIELNDFTAQEAAPLTIGLGADEETNKELLARVLYWTGGHPYLTQRLCRALAETVYSSPGMDGPLGTQLPPVLPTVRDVDRLAEKLFLSRQARDRDDNLIFVRERILRSEVDVPGLLYLYRRIHVGEIVADDETNPLVSVLHLSGIGRGVNGYLHVRNRIYRQVFDLGWIQTNMPQAEVRRQRKAGRRGIVLGLAIGAILLLGYLVVVPIWGRYHQARLARTSVERVAATYRGLGAYRDNFETTLDIGFGGTTVPITGSGSIIFDRPQSLNLTLKSALHSPEIELRLVSNGRVWVLSAPSLGQYQIFDDGRPHGLLDLPPAAAKELGPMRVLPLYRLLLDPPAGHSFLEDAGNAQPVGYAEVAGQPVRIVQWEHDGRAFLGSLGVEGPAAAEARIPVTAWINTSNNLVLQLRMDLSNWGQALIGQRSEIPITSLVITEIHKFVQTKQTRDSSPPGPFHIDVPAGARQVEQLELPPPNFATLSSPQRQFARLIPPRLSQTPRNLIDLTEYYNATFAQTWHPGLENNTLEMLPAGLLLLGGTTFDVRGIVQLSGRRLQSAGGHYPQRIAGIKLALKCRQLQFLQGTGWPDHDGSRLGSFLLHYADGQEETIPIVYGEDVRDWNAEGDPATKLTRSTVVWRGVNNARLPVRLFKTTWVNPLPQTEIATLDYVSAVADSAPFLIAITAEQ